MNRDKLIGAVVGSVMTLLIVGNISYQFRITRLENTVGQIVNALTRPQQQPNQPRAQSQPVMPEVQ